MKAKVVSNIILAAALIIVLAVIFYNKAEEENRTLLDKAKTEQTQAQPKEV